MEYSIGIDIGGTTIKGGVVDSSYKIVEHMALPTLSQEGRNSGERVVNCVVKLIKDLSSAVGVGIEQLKSVGAGIPGTIDSENGVIVYSNNIDMRHVPLRRMVYEQVGRELAMGNDADVAAYGEYVAGAAAGCESCALITLGTGVGSGIILGGKIYSGFNCRGGEFGHSVIQVGGVRCTCGREGCLEAYASATGLIRMTRDAMELNPDSLMWGLAGNLDGVDGKTAFDAMEKGDTAGQQVVDLYIKYLAAGVANLINLLHPEKVCIGGGISRSGDDLLLPLRSEVYKNLFGGADEKSTEIVLATLGNNAGIIGAAVLGRR